MPIIANYQLMLALSAFFSVSAAPPLLISVASVIFLFVHSIITHSDGLIPKLIKFQNFSVLTTFVALLPPQFSSYLICLVFLDQPN